MKALVYVDAFAPDAGETVSARAPRPGSALAGDPATVFDLVPYPGRPAGDVDLYVKPAVFPARSPTTSPRAAAACSPRRSGRSRSARWHEPSGPPAWKTIPSWYLVGTIDKVIPPAEQRFMADARARTS